MNDAELARRSVRSFAELLALVGRGGAAGATEVRRAGAVGARMPAAPRNPWFDAAVVPPETTPPVDDPHLPYCLWTLADTVPGRREDIGIALPCMGCDLDDITPGAHAPPDTTAVPLQILGAVNARAYGDMSGTFEALAVTLTDPRIATHGLRDGDAIVCVALTMRIDDNLGIFFVATEAAHRRRGHAIALLRAVATSAHAGGMRTATLHSTPDGLSVYERLGMRRVGTLRGFLRTGGTACGA